MRRFPQQDLAALWAVHARAALGDVDGARALLTRDVVDASRRDFQYALTLAEALAQLGELEQAFEFVETAIRQGFLAHRYLETFGWMLDPLKTDPRFAELVQLARERSEQAGRSLDLRASWS